MPRSFMLRLISYLAPSTPAGFFERVATAISVRAGCDVQLRFEERISGALPGDENPLGVGSADVRFVCRPTHRWLKGDLLPVPVPADPCAEGRPVYFGDVVVGADSRFASFKDPRGCRWAYNERNSRSGWFRMVERIAPEAPLQFSGETVHTGSILRA